jgi:hypothetical protein
MEFYNKYKYPFLIIIILIALGWFYLFSILDGVDEKVVSDQVLLDEYSNRMNFIAGLVTKTDLFDSDLYKELTDEFEEDVLEVGIGRINPFRPF